MWRRALLIFLGSSATWAAPRTHVEDNSRCLAVASLTDGVTQRLVRDDPSGSLSAFVLGEKSLKGRQVTLRLVANRTGVVVLEREFALKDEDCPHALKLVLAVLDAFFEQTPHSAWEQPTPEAPPPKPPDVVAPPPAPPEPRTSWWEARVAVGARWPAPSADLELGGGWETGRPADRLTVGLAVRGGLPRALASGHFFEGLGLLGVGWRHDTGPLWLHLELRAGLLLVSGYGYSGDNYTQPIFWVEGRAAISRRWSGLDFGAELTAAPLADQVNAEGRTATLSWFRFGLFVGIPL